MASPALKVYDTNLDLITDVCGFSLSQKCNPNHPVWNFLVHYEQGNLSLWVLFLPHSICLHPVSAFSQGSHFFVAYWLMPEKKCLMLCLLVHVLFLLEKHKSNSYSLMLRTILVFVYLKKCELIQLNMQYWLPSKISSRKRREKEGMFPSELGQVTCLNVHSYDLCCLIVHIVYFIFCVGYRRLYCLVTPN